MLPDVCGVLSSVRIVSILQLRRPISSCVRLWALSTSPRWGSGKTNGGRSMTVDKKRSGLFGAWMYTFQKSKVPHSISGIFLQRNWQSHTTTHFLNLLDNSLTRSVLELTESVRKGCLVNPFGWWGSYPLEGTSTAQLKLIPSRASFDMLMWNMVDPAF